jgi:hypothetical protein
MAISAQIFDAHNDFEKQLYIPVASLSFFRECWLPGIHALGLRWTELFESGVDVTVKELPIILDELHQLKKWADLNLKSIKKEHFFERVEQLEIRLPNAFQRKDAVVFIG